MQNSAAESTTSTRAWLALAIGALNAVGFGLLIAVVAPQHLALGTGGAFGIGLGLTAWTLGARHAFDPDHIAAIDNATRKLIGEGKDTESVGFFFSLGHSTIVVALGALVGLGVSGIGGALADDGSTLHLITGTWGPTVAGLFLLVVGLLNLVTLVRIGGAYREQRRGDSSSAAISAKLDAALASRGLLARLYRRATSSITKPWQMYPVGVMFGVGFDTATEIALLVLAGGAAVSGLPFYAVMCLPLLFAGGMTLFDTLNSAVMNKAYGWTLTRPQRRIAYDFALTGVTVASAFAIGITTLAHLPT
jgi:high-affinity nickel-transport protein